MRIELPVYLTRFNPKNPEEVAYLEQREKELTEELAEGGYTKKSYESADKRELKAIQKILRNS